MTRYYDALPAATETTMQVVLWREVRQGGKFVRWATCNGWDEAREEIRSECADAQYDAVKRGADADEATKAYTEMAARFHAFEETHTIARNELNVVTASASVFLS